MWWWWGAKSENPRDAALTFRPPREVARVQAQCPLLDVATANAELVDALGAQLGHGRGPAGLVKSLLLEICLAPAGGAALVPRVSGDTHVWSCTSV